VVPTGSSNPGFWSRLGDAITLVANMKERIQMVT
jgi:hypothetical protein